MATKAQVRIAMDRLNARIDRVMDEHRKDTMPCSQSSGLIGLAFKIGEIRERLSNDRAYESSGRADVDFRWLCRAWQ